MNCKAMKILVSFDEHLIYFEGIYIYLKVDLLDHKVYACLVLVNITKHFYEVIVLIYNPTNNL